MAREKRTPEVNFKLEAQRFEAEELLKEKYGVTEIKDHLPELIGLMQVLAINRLSQTIETQIEDLIGAIDELRR
ncbi:hypothetical protein V8J88_03950 [Massilia sp. W12]|uniref:hypothetical protein n=1 Tax=Massilia sp. W12 TaxID=3126507 RepID=UPI0030D44851